MSGLLQWGRNFAVAETAMGGFPKRLGFVASMGPQLCSCGNRAYIPGRRGASRGFNGAATLQLRKQSWWSVIMLLTIQLQWGRNFAVAETTWPPTVGIRRKRLQWGRNFAVAETRCSCCKVITVTQRFNGAATLQLRKQE